MKIIMSLFAVSLLSGCAVFNPWPITPYNNVYRDTQIMEQEKPCVLDLGDEKIIVESTWSKNTRGYSKNYKPMNYNISNKYYRYQDGQLHEIKVAK
jgi:hypothetical protein